MLADVTLAADDAEMLDTLATLAEDTLADDALATDATDAALRELTDETDALDADC